MIPNPTPSYAAWIQLSYSRISRSFSFTVSAVANLPMTSPLGTKTIAGSLAGILPLNRQLTRMQVGLVMRTSIPNLKVTAAFSNFTLWTTEGLTTAPIITRSFPLADAINASGSSTGGLAVVQIRLPPFVPYTLSVWLRNGTAAAYSSIGSGGNGTTSTATMILLGGPTTTGVVAHIPQRARFPLSTTRMSSLGTALWLQYGNERGVPPTTSTTSTVLYVEDVSNITAPAYAYQNTATLAATTMSSFLGEQSAWAMQWDSYMFVNDASGYRRESLDIGYGETFLLVVARAQAWYGIRTTILSKGDSSAVPGYDVFVFDDPGSLEFRVRSAAASSSVASAGTVPVVAGVQRDSPRRSAPSFCQFGVSRADTSSCDQRIIAGYENDEASTVSSMYTSGVGMSSSAASFAVGSPHGGVQPWSTTCDSAAPGGAVSALVTANSSVPACATYPSSTLSNFGGPAVCRPSGGGCASSGLPITSSPPVNMMIGAGYSAAVGAGAAGAGNWGFFGEIYEVLVLNSFPSAAEVAALRAFYMHKVSAACHGIVWQRRRIRMRLCVCICICVYLAYSRTRIRAHSSAVS